MPHRVAAYKHCAMMKLQYTVANALDESLAVLEDQDGSLGKPRRRISILARKQYYKEMNRLESKEKRKSGRSYSLSASPFPTDEASYNSNGTLNTVGTLASTSGHEITAAACHYNHDDEYELSGFDGVPHDFNPPGL